MNQYKKLLSNTLIFGIGTFSSKILVFLLMPIYTWILPPADFNVADLITQTANLIIPIAAGCIGEAVIRFGLEKSARKSDVFSCGILTVLIGFAALLLLYPILNLNPYTKGYTMLVYLYVLASSLRGVCAQFVRAKGYVRLYAFDGILSTITVIVFIILGLVVFKLGITGYVLATILSDLFSALFLTWIAGLWRYFKIKGIEKGLWKTMLLYSMPLIPNTVFFWITNVSDRYIVTALKGDEVNGLYAIAYKIPTVITAVSTIFMQAWQLSAFTESDEQKKVHFYTTVFDAYQTVLFLIGTGTILLLQPITRILVESQYYESWRYGPFLVLSVVFSCFATFFSSIYMSEKRNSMTMITTFSGAALNVVLNFILIPKFSANGAAFATFISYFTVFLFRCIHSRKYIEVKVKWLRLIANLLVLLVQAIIMIWQPSTWVFFEIALTVVMILINAKTLFTALFKLLEQRRRPA